MPRNPLIQLTRQGLYCAPGNFYIDPWGKVERAVITHAHSDHARSGAKQYLCQKSSKDFVLKRLGRDVSVQTLEYGESIQIGEVKISLHPAGHILGSAQVRVEHPEHGVWVVSGDYKRSPDPTCDAFIPIRSDVFISEATFALPIYRWDSPREVFQQIAKWWAKNQSENRTSILCCYALGKAQRILAGLQEIDPHMGPVYLHGAMTELTDIYRKEGVSLLETQNVMDAPKDSFSKALVLAPSSALNTSWMKRFKSFETAFASGWMRIRGARRYRGFDRGFVLSDHADWPQLLQSIEETQAQEVFVTHGYSNVLVDYLQLQGRKADSLKTEFHGELEE